MIRTSGLLVALAVLLPGAAAPAPLPVAGPGMWVGSALAGNERAAPRRRASSRHAHRLQLAVDQVTLKSGKTVRGAIVHDDPAGSLTLAVSRAWLRKASPDLFAKQTRNEASVRRAALEKLRDRLLRELVGVPEDSRLGAFLRSEIKRAERLLAETAPGEPQFVWLELTKKEIAKLKPVTPESRRITAWSWSEQLPNVETRDVEDLLQELKRRGIDPVQPLPDLSDRFPIRMQNDREWQSRMAIVVYALHKPLDFQGTGDLLAPVDRGAAAKDAGPLVARLLGGQVDALMKDLLGDGRPSAAKAASPDDWLKGATREADRQKVRGFRATRVKLNVGSGRASVYSAFAVRLDHGDWEVVWSDHETQDGSKERAVTEAVIADDPQVKSALGNIRSLGIAADDQVRQAIRFGAATMTAQQAIDSRFSAFEGPLLVHLDGPPLW